jgi:hypothetical protein
MRIVVWRGYKSGYTKATSASPARARPGESIFQASKRRNRLADLTVLPFMKAVVRAPIRIASISFAAALWMLAPALPAHGQTNSLTPSSNGATASAPSGNEAGQPAETEKQSVHKAAHVKKKKKPSFMNKMRDKAVEKVQKLFGSKQEPKPEPKIE